MTTQEGQDAESNGVIASYTEGEAAGQAHEVGGPATRHVLSVSSSSCAYGMVLQEIQASDSVQTEPSAHAEEEEPGAAPADEPTHHEVSTEERDAAAEEQVASPSPVHDILEARPEPPSPPKLEQLPVERPPAQYHHVNMKVQWDKGSPAGTCFSS